MNADNHEPVNVSIKNIGGIDTATFSLSDGVTILTGENATNRTSTLQAIMAALGSNEASLKGDADEGSVQLDIGDATYTRYLRRNGEQIQYEGEPYLDDPTVADLFAFVLESSATRQAVRRGDDLRDIIMRPIDTDQIESDIKQCQRDRDEIETQLERLDELETEVLSLTEQREDKQSTLGEVRAELEEIESKIERRDANIADEQSIKQKREDTYVQLREAQSTLDSLTYDLETEQETLDTLEQTRDEVTATLDDVSEVVQDDTELQQRIEDLRERKTSLTRRLTDLNSIIEFNEEMLDERPEQVLKQTHDRKQDQTALTAQLVEETTTCWTCGSDVSTAAIRDTVDDIKSVRQGIVAEQNEVTSTIDELVTRQNKIKEKKREREELIERLESIDDEIKTTEENIKKLEAQVQAKEVEIAELKDEVQSLETDTDDTIIQLHQDATEKEVRIERLEDEIDELTETITNHEATIATRSELVDERDALTERLTNLRNRVDQIEADAVSEFNDRMEIVLELLGYDNLDRIWIEQKETDVREDRRTTSQSTFDIHVVRTTADGVAYEDALAHLSESEREVTGLVFALAGYLVHDVSDTVPFILLDSLEAIDKDRIAKLINHFESETTHLVTALLTEDAAGLPDEYQYINSIA
jgi:DNA repair exonuclease SbcCD ATPase subunit